jgi:hypothetical protein
MSEEFIIEKAVGVRSRNYKVVEVIGDFLKRLHLAIK